MSDGEFEELVNLYLDKEISEEQLWRLEEELKYNPERRQVFSTYRRLNDASRIALCSGHAKKIFRRRAQLQERQSQRTVYYFAHAGMAAACVILAFVVFNPIGQQGGSETPVVLGGNAPDLDASRNPGEVLAQNEAAGRSALPVVLAEVSDVTPRVVRVMVPEASGVVAETFDTGEEFFQTFIDAETGLPLVRPDFNRRSFPVLENFGGFEARPAAVRTLGGGDAFRAEFTNFYFQR